MLARTSHRLGWAAAGLALAVRLGLIALVPVLPMGDSYGRLFHATQLVQGPWLPGLQLELALVSLFTRASLVFRVLAALQGSAAVGLATATACEIAGSAAGATAMVALAWCPLLAWTSTGAYQEPVFDLCLSAAAYSWVRGRRSASLGWWVAAECIRYEAWLFAPVVAIARRNPRDALVLAAFPVVWLIVWQGLSPVGPDSLSPSLAPGRLPELAVAWHTLAPWWLGPGLLLLGVPGLISAWEGVTPASRFARAALAWGALDLALLVLLHPYSPATNARQLGVAVWVAVAVAVAGTARLQAIARPLAWLAPVLAIPPIWHLSEMNRWSDTVAARPAWEAGRGVASAVPRGDRVLVLARGWPEYPAADARECAVVGVAAGRDDRAILCDAALPLDADPERWLADREIRWILRFEPLVPWRPVHGLAGPVVARFGTAELVHLPGPEGPR